jgi:hypothetical protein
VTNVDDIPLAIVFADKILVFNERRFLKNNANTPLLPNRFRCITYVLHNNNSHFHGWHKAVGPQNRTLDATFSHLLTGLILGMIGNSQPIKEGSRKLPPPTLGFFQTQARDYFPAAAPFAAGIVPAIFLPAIRIPSIFIPSIRVSTVARLAPVSVHAST